MVRTSVLNDALKNINNAEKAGKRQVLIRPSSKVIIKFLSVMQRHGMWLISFPLLDDLAWSLPFPIRHDNWTTVSKNPTTLVF